jgi:hypothetical protein
MADALAPEVGAKLPALTALVLAGRPLAETGFRSGDRGAKAEIAAVGYLVMASAVAIDVYRSLSASGKVKVLHAVLRASFRDAAPPAQGLAPRVRELIQEAATTILLAAAPTAPGSPPLLDHAEIQGVQQAALLAGLDRSALLAGVNRVFAGLLPFGSSPGAQLLLDLDTLNHAGALEDGSMPLRSWLDNALLLSGVRPEAAVFQKARARLPG